MKRMLLLMIGLGVWLAGYYCGQAPGSPDLHGWVQDRGDLRQEAEAVAEDHPAGRAVEQAAGFLREQARAIWGDEDSPQAQPASEPPPLCAQQNSAPPQRAPVPQCW